MQREEIQLLFFGRGIEISTAKINSISKIIISECTEHWDELTREIKDKNGCEVNIFRHNGIAENNHMEQNAYEKKDWKKQNN
jgi:hypothetical protein